MQLMRHKWTPGVWVAVRDPHTSYCGSLTRCLLFLATGRAHGAMAPFWTFRVSCSAYDGQDAYAECSAGFFSRWLYFEVLQGKSMCDGMFYRWLRVGIPRHGALRIRLQKRWIG